MESTVTGKAYIEDGHIYFEWASWPGKEALDKIKSLPDQKWISDENRWRVPCTRWYMIQAIDLFEHTLEVQFNVDPTALEIPWFEKLQTGKESLYPFQEKAVQFIWGRGGRCILGDEMGLGKTVEALVYAEHNSKIQRVLVVAPANVIYKWEAEVLKWTRFTPNVIKNGKSLPTSDTCQIVSYDLMKKLVEPFKQWSPDLLIFDEFHYLKGQKTKVKRVQAGVELGRTVPQILFLSGTPIINRPNEIFNALNLLNPIAFPSFWTFGNRYCGGQRMHWSGATNRDELAERLSYYMIRRTKGEVLDELPDLTRTKVPVDIPDMREYRKVAKNVFEAIKAMDPKHKGYYVNALDRLNLLRRCIGRGKARVALPYIEEFLLSTSRKMVVYCKHHEVVDYLKEGLHEYGVTTITGKVPANKRHERIGNFQTNSDIRLMLITSAGGQGIDLFGIGSVEISNILFVEREWSPSIEEQAEARLHRIGQTLPVEATYLIARSTVDTVVDSLIESKRSLLDELIGIDDISVVTALLEELL